MSLRSDRVEAEIASILLDTNAARLQDLVDEAGLGPLIQAYIREHFDAERVEDLDNRQMRDVLTLISAFRGLAKGAAG